MLSGKIIVIGICGRSTASKTIELISALKKEHADVYVVMTKNSTNFVTPLMVQRSVDHPIAIDHFELPKVWESGHKSLPDIADLSLIAPASANMLGKAAWGIADDLLSTTIMSMRKSIVFATHINDKMYASPSVRCNVKTLNQDGFTFVENNRSEHPGLFPTIELITSSVMKTLGAN